MREETGVPEDRAGDHEDGSRGPEADEVGSLHRSLAEEQQRNLRLLADFDNLRRRVSREREAAREEGRRTALRPLLPVIEILDQALAAGSTDRDFYEGVAATRRLFLAALHEAGAEPIESVGRPFDPRFHEAVATVPSEGAEPGTVVRELRRGWRIGDELLTPAQVEIAASEEIAGPWR